MFDFLRGRLASKAPTEVVIDCGGVGYLLQISLNTFGALPEDGEVQLWVQPVYTETAQRLYGFATEIERTVFRLVQGVKGIGPTLALNLMSHDRPEQMVARLRTGEVTALTRVKGIGKKTAERLLVELKDRLPAQGSETSRPNLESVLIQALTSLGLNASEADTRCRRTLEQYPDENSVEVLLRHCLQEGVRAAGR